MAIVFDSAASAQGNSTEISFNLSIGSGASTSRLVVVGFSVVGTSVGAVHIDNHPLFFVNVHEEGNLKTYLYYQLDNNLPLSAGTYPVQVFVGTGVVNVQAVAVSVRGAKQAAPEVTLAGGRSTAASSFSTSVTAVSSGAWAFDVVGTLADGISTLTATPGQVKRGQRDNTVSDVALSTRELPAAAAVNIGWAFSAAAARIGQNIAVFGPAESSPAPGPRDIRLRVMKVVTPAASGNLTVRGVGFRGAAALFWGVPVKDTSVEPDAAQWLGVVDNAPGGLHQKCVMVSGRSGSASTRRAADRTNAVSILRADSPTPVVVGRVTSWDADGFTLNFSSSTQGYIINALVIGGQDLRAYVGEAAVSAQAVTGVGFETDLCFAISNGDALNNGASAPGKQSFGAFDKSGNQWWLGSYQGNDAADQSAKDSLVRSTGFVGHLASSVGFEASLNGVHGNGFSWTGTHASGFFFLALNFAGARARVGVFNKSTGSAPLVQQLPDAGWTAGGYLLASAVKNAPTPAQSPGTRVAIGAFDGSFQRSTLRTDESGVQNADQRTSNDRVLGLGGVDAAYSAVARALQLAGTAPALEWNPNDSQARSIAYVFFEQGTASTLGMSAAIAGASVLSAKLTVSEGLRTSIRQGSEIVAKLGGGVPVDQGVIEVVLDADSVLTSDGTLTTLSSYALPPNTVLFATVEIGAHDLAQVSKMQTWLVEFMASAERGIIATGEPKKIAANLPWTVTVTQSGAQVLVRGQGAPNTKLRWSAVLRGHFVFQPVKT